MRWTLFALTLASTATFAQERPTFRAQTDVVVIHAMVEDRRGAAVPDLTADNFIIYEDNFPQKISFFSSADAPASIGLLIDNSTSMAPQRERVVAAAVQFSELSNPEDEIFVLAFNERVNEAWAPRIIHDSDASSLQATLLNHIAARGKTALYDAVQEGLDRLSRALHTRQVLVIVSDGGDNASRSDLDTMLKRVRLSQPMIYTVVLQDPVDGGGDPRLMQRLAEETGGETFKPRRAEQVSDALEHIARDIRATYTLGYVPLNQARDGKVRKLRVVASDGDGRPLKVQTRAGYQAPVLGSRGGGGINER